VTAAGHLNPKWVRLGYDTLAAPLCATLRPSIIHHPSPELLNGIMPYASLRLVRNGYRHDDQRPLAHGSGGVSLPSEVFGHEHIPRGKHPDGTITNAYFQLPGENDEILSS